MFVIAGGSFGGVAPHAPVKSDMASVIKTILLAVILVHLFFGRLPVLFASASKDCNQHYAIMQSAGSGALTGIKMAYHFQSAYPATRFSFFVGRVDLRHHHLRPLGRVALAAGQQDAPVGGEARHRPFQCQPPIVPAKPLAAAVAAGGAFARSDPVT
jgi:hypothetical protein